MYTLLLPSIAMIEITKWSELLDIYYTCTPRIVTSRLFIFKIPYGRLLNRSQWDRKY